MARSGYTIGYTPRWDHFMKHTITITTEWCNDSSSDLIVACDPCPTGIATYDRGKRYTPLYCGNRMTLTLERLNEIAAAHLAGNHVEISE